MGSLSRLLLAALAVAAWALSAPVLAQGVPIAIVIMHGKGGAPTGLVAGLARSLESQDYLVANLDMPWSGRRHYDGAVERAQEQVEAAVADLRGKGAKQVFIAGHSQGGAFALYLAGRVPADGYILITPGGNVDNAFFWGKVKDSVARAQQLVGEKKGADPVALEDFEGARGSFQVVTAPATYLTWFEQQGAMNMERAARAAHPKTPVLWLGATRDQPSLRTSNNPLFRALPPNPLSRFRELNADHRGAPSAAVEEIVLWTKEVAGAAR